MATTDYDAQLEQVKTITTGDATVTTIDTYVCPDPCTVYVEATVLGNIVGAAGGAAYRLVAAFRNYSGVSQLGSTVQDQVFESDAAFDATIDNSGTSIRVRVTGKAATGLNWISFTKIYVKRN